MKATLNNLLDRYEDHALQRSRVIPWSAPVPAFGDPMCSSVATLGLNPSNREFVDVAGRELDGAERRFHTLRSLGISRWSDANARHARKIADSCRHYFSGRPYDTWFKKLDFVISGTRSSYYDPTRTACHLDLIPYATACKWTELRSEERASLLQHSGDTLALLLRESAVRVLILNGASVVSNFESLASVQLASEPVASWTLPRRGHGVVGVGYSGIVRKIGSVTLGRELLVLGFNHNIQSSFGVTRAVVEAIRSWIALRAKQALE